MNNGLHDVIAAAVHSAGQLAAMNGKSKAISHLRTVDTDRSPAAEASAPVGAPVDPAITMTTRRRRRTPADGDDIAAWTDTGPHELTGGAEPTAARGEASAGPAPSAPAAGDDRLGPGALRLAFWLCGFHDALTERRRQGERLTDSEELLLRMSSRDFLYMRPSVVDMTLGRLKALVNSAALTADLSASRPGAMELFALETLRDLAQRACQLNLDAGPDAALALFGGSPALQEPLGIFQQVFSTALDIVEAFERAIPGEAKLLARLAENLDSEVERI